MIVINSYHRNSSNMILEGDIFLWGCVRVNLEYIIEV